MINVLKSYYIILKNIFRKNVTLEYPKKKNDKNKNLIGAPVYDISKCIRCALCVKNCPSLGALKMDKESYIINSAKCIQCGQCIRVCPTNALRRSGEYENATQNKNDLIKIYKGG